MDLNFGTWLLGLAKKTQRQAISLDYFFATRIDHLLPLHTLLTRIYQHCICIESRCTHRLIQFAFWTIPCSLLCLIRILSSNWSGQRSENTIPPSAPNPTPRVNVSIRLRV